MEKRTLRTIISLIPSFICLVFFGWLLTVLKGIYYVIDIICGVGIILPVIAAVLILVWKFDLIKNIKYYLVNCFVSGIIILITWLRALDTGRGEWVLCSVPAVLLSALWFWENKRPYKEIIVLLLLHPVIYYLIFFLVFIVGLAYG